MELSSLLSVCCIFFYHLWHDFGSSAFFHSQQEWMREGFEWGGQVWKGIHLYFLSIFCELTLCTEYCCLSLCVCIHISLGSHGTASICPVFWSEALDVVLAACHVERLSGWFDGRVDGDGVGVMKWVWVGFAAGGPSPSHHTGYGMRHGERRTQTGRLLPHHLLFFSQICLFPYSQKIQHNSKHITFNSLQQQRNYLSDILYYAFLYPPFWVCWMTMSFLLKAIDSVNAGKHAGRGTVSLQCISFHPITLEPHKKGTKWWISDQVKLL